MSATSLALSVSPWIFRGSAPRSATPTTADVVDAVASVVEASPLELPPLQDSVDAEALERVLRSSADSQLSFAYCGHRIVASGDGTVTVYPTPGGE